ncbi:hypothetical protein CH63R_00482 [Colletotrichum higginsianum IMI 349063]|uniref:DUF2406 domain-containing protein n=2 Tax=Colletotrichum higginsianum TaxID=80884 RepID=A0A1B7YTM3_COLHI|nr:hypothetical protein CH63R_00482 [Colletotrichum higginsianum IMI 349063]OBR15302.1 hypothetical protein CH63R_00482 [Colletotrichum higginsianum IMI 349063]
MAEHHPLPALPPQHQQPNQQFYHDGAANSYNEPSTRFPSYQQPYDQPPRQQTQTQQIPPIQKQPQSPHRRPRTFSFQSNRSHKSSGSHHKIDLHESHQEKEAKRLHSKADPTVAMSEAEPSAVQAMTKSSLAPLRAIQHKDTTGNPISEPDRSNPTRSRWERPLDTIRSFEAAIDGGYRDRDRRQSYRSDAESVATWNRRSSYYATSGNRHPHDSYYGGRPGSFRPESTQIEMGSTRQSYYDQYHNGAGGGYYNGNIPYRQRVPRTQTDPHMNGYGRGDQTVYPLSNKDRSYETVTSAAGSGSSAEHAGYHTDPTSSDNSSIERAPAPRPEPVNDYGIGFSQGQSSYQPSAFSLDNGTPNGKGPAHSSVKQGPQISGKGANVLRRPAAAPPQQQQQQQQQQPPPPQQPQERPESSKRKSWFSRRFSKAS